MKLRRVSMRLIAVILVMMMAVTMNLTAVSATVVLPAHRTAQTFSYDGLTKDTYLDKLAERGVDVTSGKEFIPIPWGSMPGEQPTPYIPVTEGVNLSPHTELGNQTLASMGIVDVTAAPFNIDNTGTTDVTEKLQDALTYGKKNQMAVFLPSGTYLVSDTLLLQTGIAGRTKDNIDVIANRNEMPTVLIGSRQGSGATIKLMDNAPTFDDPLNAKAVLHYFQPEITTNKDAKEVTIDWSGKHAADREGNITIDHINIVTGNNSGAIGIHMASAQGGVIQDVNINATGGLVGIMGGAGNGGSWTNITVTGGKFGYDSRLNTILLQSIQNMTLQNQTGVAWLAGNGGSATVAGLKIVADYAGPAIIKGSRGQPYFGSQSIIDAEIIYTTPYDGPAIAGSAEIDNFIDNVAWPSAKKSSANIPVLSDYLPKGLYMNNVYFQNVAKVVNASTYNPQVDANKDGWFHIKEFAYGKDEKWTNNTEYGTVNWKNSIYIDKAIYSDNTGTEKKMYLGTTTKDIAPPSDLASRHGWLPGQIPSFETPGLVDIKAVYGVAGDGQTDDTAALQKAIDENEYVFLPKGYYRITNTLKLKPDTKLFGLCTAYSYIFTNVFDTPSWGGGPKPLVETADDKNANTIISDITITPAKEVPITFEGSYPLYSIKWQSGSNSIMRTVQVEPTRTYGFQGSDNAAAYGMKSVPYEYPTLLFTGNAGGKIYNVYNQLFGSSFVPTAMRLMAIRGTTNPLSIYAANWEYIKSNASVEISNSQNVTLYGNKTEDNTTYIDISDSNNIRIFGHSGSGSAAYQATDDIVTNINSTTVPDIGDIDPNKKGSFYKVTNTTNLLITNLNDQVTVKKNPKSGLGLVQSRYDLFWPIKVDSDPVPSDTRPVMYKLGNPTDGFLNDATAPAWTDGNLAVSNMTVTGVTLTWSGASDNVAVSGYKILKDGVELATVPATTNRGTYDVTGLTLGTTYTFKVEARDAAGNWTTDGPSTTVTISDVIDPVWVDGNVTSTIDYIPNPSGTAVTTKDSTLTNLSLTLNWNAASDNVGVTGYKVYKDETVLATVAGITYKVTGLANNTTYTFRIEAADAAGNTTALTKKVTTPTYIFTDSFDPAIGGGWTNEGATHNTSNKFDGANSLQLNENDKFYSTVSTVGYSNIKISYARKTGANHAATDHFISEWSPDGNTWYTIEDLTGTNTGTGPTGFMAPAKTFTFPAEANNNSSFAIRFRTITGTSGKTTNYAYVDAIKIEGILDNQAPTWTNENVTVSDQTHAGVILSWSGATDNVGVTGYKVLQGEVELGTVTGTVYNVSGLTANTQYTFTIEARDAVGNWSGNGPSITVKTTAVSSAINPTSATFDKYDKNVDHQDIAVTVTPNGNKVNAIKNGLLTLAENAHYTVSGEVYTIKKEYLSTLTNGTVTLTFDMNAGADPTLRITVGDSTPDTQAPQWTSGNVTASNVTQTTLTLTWSGATHNEPVVAYAVYKNGSPLTTLGNVTTYDVTDLTANTRYTFKVEAADAVGNWSVNGPSTAVTTAENGPADNEVPTWTDGSVTSTIDYIPNPSGTAVTTKDSTLSNLSVTLNWNAANDNVGVTGYKVYKDGTELATVTGATYRVTGLANNTTYTFRIEARDAAGNWSTTGPGNKVTTPTYLFTESFDPAIGGGWTNEVAAVNTTNRFDGTNSLQLNENDKFYRTVSTVGYSTIKISYARKTGANHAATDHFISEWSPDGNTWHTIEDLTGTNTGSGPTGFMAPAITFTFPAEADNNSSFAIRFRTTTETANKTNNFAYVDAIKIEGVPDNEAPIWTNASIEELDITQTGVTLSWTRAFDTVGVKAYKVVKDGTTVAESVYGTVYSVTGLTAGTRYMFTVEAVDGAGNWSTNGPGKTVTTLAEPSPEDTQAPTWTNGNVEVKDKTQTTVTLKWNGATDTVGVTGYKVFKNGDPIATVTDAVYTVTGLTAGTTYTFRIEARDEADNWTTNGPSIQVTTLTVSSEPDTTAPTWTNGTVSTSNIGKNTVTLTWSGASDNVGVAGYKILKGGVELGTVTGSVYTVTGLTASTNYTFKIEARDAVGNWSTTGPSVTMRTEATRTDSTVIPTPPQPEVPQPKLDATTGKATVEIKATVDTASATAKAEVKAETITKALEQAKADSQGVKTIFITIPKVDGAKAYEPVLPAATLTQAAATQKVEIKTEVASLVVPGNMLKTAAPAQTANVALTIAAVDKTTLSAEAKAAVGNRPVIELNVKVDGKVTAWNNPDAPVKVSIPYKPTEQELKNPEHIVVYYIDGTGKAIPVPNGKYDAKTGEVTFTTTHFSKYAVSYVEKNFTDIADVTWAKKEIEVLASKGVINGTSDSTFTPSANITRADFLVLLVKTLGLTAKVEDNFSDVSKTDYYYEALGIAKKLGISQGRGNNLFDPNAEISRQEMMALTARAMKLAGKLTATGSSVDLKSYSDKDGVASYAVESIAQLVKDGVVKGDGTTLNPEGNATRAEVAVMMYRIYNK